MEAQNAEYSIIFEKCAKIMLQIVSSFSEKHLTTGDIRSVLRRKLHQSFSLTMLK